MKKLLFISLLFLCYNSISQNRAPSVYLDYNKDVYQGDIIINTLRVISPVPLYTYYNAMVFGGSNGDGGGYCGMQSSPQGKNYIFSLWDPNTTNKEITADYIGDGTTVKKFGGEGTGLQSFNYKISWKPNEWYSFVTRIWNINEKSYYGFWIFDHKNETWYHIVTMNYPVKNLNFSSRTCAFIEDWMGNGSEIREIHRKNGWKRKINSEWFPFTEGTISRVYPDAGCSNYINNYDGGVIDDYFFIKSGGTISANNTSGTTIKISNNNSKPKFISCEINNLTSTIKNDSIELQWHVNSSKLPQYSYTIELYDNPNFVGEPFFYYKKIKPQEKKCKIKINKNNFYIKMYINDILDNKSNILTNSYNNDSLLTFTNTTKVNNNQKLEIYPNPATTIINIGYDMKTVEIYNISGSKQHIINNNDGKIDISSLTSGVYIVKAVNNFNELFTNKFIKQ